MGIAACTWATWGEGVLGGMLSFWSMACKGYLVEEGQATGPRAPSHLPVSSPELLCGGSPEPCANGGTCLRLSQGQGTCQ